MNPQNRKQVKLHSSHINRLTFACFFIIALLVYYHNIYNIVYQGPEALTLNLLTLTYCITALNLERNASNMGQLQSKTKYRFVFGSLPSLAEKMCLGKVNKICLK